MLKNEYSKENADALKKKNECSKEKDALKENCSQDSKKKNCLKNWSLLISTFSLVLLNLCLNWNIYNNNNMKQVTSSFGDHWHHCMPISSSTVGCQPSPPHHSLFFVLLVAAIIVALSYSAIIVALSSSSQPLLRPPCRSYHRCSLLLITVLGCIERNVYLINQLIARAFNYNCVPLRWCPSHDGDVPRPVSSSLFLRH